jgi:hypothetical protein
MITFALTSVLAASGVFGAWGFLEVKKTCGISEIRHQHLVKDDDVSSTQETEESFLDVHLASGHQHYPDAHIAEAAPVGGPHSSSNGKSAASDHDKKLPEAISHVETSLLLDDYPTKEEKKQNDSKMNDLINILETELEKRKQEEQQQKRDHLTKLIEVERKRRLDLEQQEKDKNEKKRLEDEKRSVLGRQVFGYMIDQSLRAKKNFPSNNPLSYEGNLSNVCSEFEGKRANFNAKYANAVPETVLEFLLSCNRFVVNEEKKVIKLDCLTPYQGGSKVTGYFICPTCSRQWRTNASVKDTSSKCKHCNLDVYPFRQDFDENELLPV